MRTTSLLNVGPSVTCGGGGCNTARCRAATSAKAKADARMMRRMSADATSYSRAHSQSRRTHSLLVRIDGSAVVRDPAVDDGQHARRVGKGVDGNLEDVLRQPCHV